MKTKLSIPASLCVRCRGGRFLCGLSFCPIQVKLNIKSKISIVNGSRFSGSSPPGIFVGHYGYPKLGVYPVSSIEHGDTSFYEDPKRWLSMKYGQFIEERSSMIRGKIIKDASVASDPDYLFQEIQIMSLSDRSIEVEMDFDGNIREDFELDEHSPPMGPAAPLRKFSAENSSVGKRAEKVYYDTDLKAESSIIQLYNDGVDVWNISKIMSIGAMGVKRRRKLVPTRWAITSVDSTLSDYFVEKIKDFETIDNYEVYIRKVDGNLFISILLPEKWIFEWGEAWFPGSSWNYFGQTPYVEIDGEGYNGRNEYPEIGGCYYSSRLATSEFLIKRKRQSGAITWREIYPSFSLPLGVWFVRENMRKIYEEKPMLFNDLKDAFNYISGFMSTDIRQWKEKSPVFNTLRNNLDRFFR
ncbi:Nre family DNA repair protein [Caldiplasma sukawensis]